MDIDEVVWEERLRWRADHIMDAKQRKALRMRIAAGLAPTMEAEGFVKYRSTFMRIHGEHLFQAFSVICRDVLEEPTLVFNAYPMCNLFKTGANFTSGLDNYGIDGETPETHLGIQLDWNYNSYLAHQEDLDAAISKELELVKKIFPVLDQMNTLEDYLHFAAPEGFKFQYGNGLSYLLYLERYDQANETAKSWIEYLEEILKKRALEVNCSLEEYKQRPGLFQPYLNIAERILKALNEGDRASITRMLNESLEDKYACLAKRSKKFSKMYPMIPVPENRRP